MADKLPDWLLILNPKGAYRRSDWALSPEELADLEPLIKNGTIAEYDPNMGDAMVALVRHVRTLTRRVTELEEKAKE